MERLTLDDCLDWESHTVAPNPDISGVGVCCPSFLRNTWCLELLTSNIRSFWDSSALVYWRLYSWSCIISPGSTRTCHIVHKPHPRAMVFPWSSTLYQRIAMQPTKDRRTVRSIAGRIRLIICSHRLLEPWSVGCQPTSGLVSLASKSARFWPRQQTLSESNETRESRS